MKTLTQRRSDALQRTDQSAAQTIQEAKEIRNELSELQEKLEDLTVLKTAVQGKVAVYKNNAPKAAEIRNEISSELLAESRQMLQENSSTTRRARENYC